MRLRLRATGLLLLGLSSLAASAADPDPAGNEPAARRDRLERLGHANPYAITPHRPNFVLPLSYAFKPHRPPGMPADANLDALEVQFQLSFKVLAWDRPFGTRLALYGAYTNQSWWQAYNETESSPFRETNHEPEAFVRTTAPLNWRGLRDLHFGVGASHQSNGQSLPRSRSWNRIYTTADFRWQRVFFALRIWQRLHERAKAGPEDPRGDDNPGIGRYYGPFELNLAWVRNRKRLTATWRNNLRQDNKGAIQLGFSYPLSSKLKGYVSYFNGYGESLIDYNRSSSRLGVGIALSDWP